MRDDATGLIHTQDPHSAADSLRARSDEARAADELVRVGEVRRRAAASLVYVADALEDETEEDKETGDEAAEDLLEAIDGLVRTHFPLHRHDTATGTCAASHHAPVTDTAAPAKGTYARRPRRQGAPQPHESTFAGRVPPDATKSWRTSSTPPTTYDRRQSVSASTARPQTGTLVTPALPATHAAGPYPARPAALPAASTRSQAARAQSRRYHLHPYIAAPRVRVAPIRAQAKRATTGAGAALLSALAAGLALLLFLVLFCGLLLGGADEDRRLCAQRLADAARMELSRVREDGTYGYKGERYRAYTQDMDAAWDADFVSWCASEASLQDRCVLGRFGDVSSIVARIHANPDLAEVHEPEGYLPCPGDLALWHMDEPFARVGIVASAVGEGTFEVIEGDAAGGETLSHDTDEDGVGGYVAARTAGSSEDGLVFVRLAFLDEEAGAGAPHEEVV